MKIRKYQPMDLKEIAQLYYDTINSINIQDYRKEQIEIWSNGYQKLLYNNDFFVSLYTIVAVEDTIIVGYGNIDNTGYLNHLYVHKDYQTQGIGTIICNELEKTMNTKKVCTAASITAKPFFEKRGYKIIKEQQVKMQGINFINFLMEKNILL